MDPNSGTFEMVSWVSSSISPPRTIVWPSSARAVVSIALLFVIKSTPLDTVPATPETSILISNKTELPSLIWGVISSLIPTSCLDVVLNGFALFEPRLSPVVIGISWPIIYEAVSLSIASKDGVERILEFTSREIALIMAAKLSPPALRSPKPATIPCVFNNEVNELVVKAVFVSSAAPPTIESKSGPESLNLVIPIGISPFSDPPENTVSTPKSFAAFSDNSTITASTSTWALLISNFEIKFFKVLIFDWSEDITIELVFSWLVMTVDLPSEFDINLPDIEFRIEATSLDLAYFK